MIGSMFDEFEDVSMNTSVIVSVSQQCVVPVSSFFQKIGEYITDFQVCVSGTILACDTGPHFLQATCPELNCSCSYAHPLNHQGTKPAILK